MKLSDEKTDYLLKLEKKIVVDSIIYDNFTINQSYPYKLRFELFSEDDEEFSFLWVVNQSAKSKIKLSLHYQENEVGIGLIRVDYNAPGHHNPEVAIPSLPPKFLPYIGKKFDNQTPHIHYHVDNYKTLSWAIPLSDIVFAPQIISDSSDLNSNLAAAIKSFADLINLKTEIIINQNII